MHQPSEPTLLQCSQLEKHIQQENLQQGNYLRAENDQNNPLTRCKHSFMRCELWFVRPEIVSKPSRYLVNQAKSKNRERDRLWTGIIVKDFERGRLA